MGRIIAIDYGQKRVGIAVTDEDQRIAGPLETIHAKDILQFLRDYLGKEKVSCIIVGMPRQMDFTLSESEAFIEPFVNKLRKMFPAVLIDRMDERFTSKMATEAIMISGKKKKDRQDKSLVDKISATLILQSYLEMKAFEKNRLGGKLFGDATVEG